jgi:AraC family transcriptional regulator of adaptative response/methylated-DNA-[protein]-cysteine methyltransferase
MSNYDEIAKIVNRIIANKTKPESLEELAKVAGKSPGHLQKVFTEWVGITPKQFCRYLSLSYAKGLLEDNKTTLATSTGSGLSGGGRLYDLFVTIESMTPGEYQNQGENLTILYTTFETPFGKCLVASTPLGVCAVLFFDTKKNAVEDLQSRFKRATLREKEDALHASIKQYFTKRKQLMPLKLHLHGTNFQIKVWEALLSIPEGSIINYGEIAERLGDKKMARAVGTAIGNNPIAHIIPCHRVLTATGEIGGYRWGENRKRAILFYEAIKRDKESHR